LWLDKPSVTEQRHAASLSTRPNTFQQNFRNVVYVVKRLDVSYGKRISVKCLD
jgi:hypothetical protein